MFCIYHLFCRQHPLLSSAILTASGRVTPHQSFISSNHRLLGLPCLRTTSDIPSITSLTILSFLIRQICPKRPSFLFLILSISVLVLPTRFLTSSFFDFSCPTDLQYSSITSHFTCKQPSLILFL